MNYFIVSYDIDEKNPRDLDNHLIDLQKQSLSCKPLNNVWIVKTDLSRKDLYNQYKSKLKSDDRLLVSSIPEEYAFFNMIKDARQFVKDNNLID